MAVTYGFFNSVNGDRKYNAEQMSEYFRGIINEGVYQHLDGGLAVTAGTGLAVNVAAGRAIIQNRWIQNSAAMSLTIAAASETYARKDAVVIRLNWSSRAISIVVKTGTPAASPVAPSMTRNATTYEMALAYVNVAAGASSVTVTDKRSDSSVCGWAAVAQATSGEVDAMLNAMKTGFDGVPYSSPAAMVQGCDTKLQDEIDYYFGVDTETFSFQLKTYVIKKSDGSLVSTGSGMYGSLGVKPGEQYHFRTYIGGDGTVAPYAFYDETGFVSAGDEPTSLQWKEYDITIPSGITMMRVCSRSPYVDTVILTKKKTNIDDIMDGLNSIAPSLTVNATKKYIDGLTGEVTSTAYNTSIMETKIDPRAYSIYLKLDNAGSALSINLGYRFLDASGNIIQNDFTKAAKEMTFKIPYNAAKLQISYENGCITDTITYNVNNNGVNLPTVAEASLHESKNLFNKNDLLPGHNLIYNGTISSSSYNLYVSNLIPCQINEKTNKLTISSRNNLSTSMGYLFKDANGNVISYGNYTAAQNMTITIPDNAAFIQVTVDDVNAGEETIDTFMLEYGSSASTYTAWKGYWSEPQIKDVIANSGSRRQIHINNTGTIMDFYDSMLEAYNLGNSDVYIHGGTYTYTNAMIDAIRADSKRGVPIGNGNRYFFDSTANIICEYTGANKVDVGGMFSPLDTWNTAGSFELHNLDVLSKNTIYAVHDESAGQSTPCRHVYENCKIVLDNSESTVSGYDKAIGGGLGADEEIIMRNCIFESTRHPKVDISYHGNANGDRLNIVVEGCYFAKTFGIDDTASSAPNAKRMIFTGNSVTEEPVVLNEDSGNKWEVISWGNTIHNS